MKKSSGEREEKRRGKMGGKRRLSPGSMAQPIGTCSASEGVYMQVN